MAAYPCSDDPSEIIENIVGAGENAEKFNRFVNGGVNEDVQLGTGQPTPTIRKTVRLMKSASAEIDGSDVSGKFSTASGGTASRMLDERFGDMLNVRDFGAVGDGVTDDTAAFEAAAASGLPVLVPNGNYALSKPVQGGSLTMLDGVTFSGFAPLYKERATNYRKSIAATLPFQFSGYSNAVAAAGATSFYPQGHCFDEDGNLYISYLPNGVSASTGLSCIVKYDEDFAFVGYLFVAYGVENVVVLKEGNKKYLYHRKSSEDALYKYEITNASFSGETLTGTKVLSSVDANYCYDAGSWYVFSRSPDLGMLKSRTVIKVFDRSFNPLQIINIPRTVTGFQTNSEAYYNYIPKMQGFVAANGRLYIGRGGYFKPASEGQESPTVADIGCTEMSTQGDILRSSLVNASGFLAKLQDLGVDADHTESEGVAVHPDGGLYSLYVVLGNASSGRNEGGILIVREFAEDGVDFSNVKSRYSEYDLQRYINGPFPRCKNANGDDVVLNPVTGEEIESVQDLLDLMINMQLPRLTYYTSSTSLQIVGGTFTIPSGSYVELVNANNLTVFIFIRSTQNIGLVLYSAYHDSDSGTWSLSAVKNVTASKFRLRDPQFQHILSESYDYGESFVDALLLGANVGSDAHTTMTYGGSSTVYRAVTLHDFWCAEAAGDLTGVDVMRIDSSHVYPPSGRSGEIHLGTGDARWAQVYIAAGSVSTSDERMKQDIEAVPEAVLRAWERVHFQQYRFRDAVAKKGENARVHVGVIAQRVKEAFEAEGLDPFKYGLLCYDEWDATPAETDETGAVVTPAVPAGDMYSVRYDECLALECAYQRWRLEQIEARLNEISGNSPAPSGVLPDNI